MVDLSTYDPGVPERFHVLVTREQWGALPPKSVTPVELPAKHLRFTHTATDRCETEEECVQAVRDLQLRHMNQGCPDIVYNFLVGGDNRVYEGRGWYAAGEISAQFDHLRNKTIDLAFFGDYPRHVKVPLDMIDVARGLVDWGTDHKMFVMPFTVYEYYKEFKNFAMEE